MSSKTRCEFCKKKFGGFEFTCSYCKKDFCVKCRLQEDHKCTQYKSMIQDKLDKLTETLKNNATIDNKLEKI